VRTDNGPQPAHDFAHPAGGRHRRWIEMYSSPEFAALAEWCRGLLDRFAAGLAPEAQGRLEAAFLTSGRHEHLFWEAAYRRQGRPV
jgi:thiaminase/transcriptional activator TenA